MKARKIILMICGMILMSGNAMAQNNEVKKSTVTKQTKIKLGIDNIDVDKTKAKWYFGLKINEQIETEKMRDYKKERKIIKKVYSWPNSNYFIKVKNQTDDMVCQYCDIGLKLESKLELYMSDGKKILEKEFNNRNILEAVALKNGLLLLKFQESSEKERHRMMSREIYEIYNKGEIIYSFKGKQIVQFAVSPQANYILILQKRSNDKTLLKKLGLNGKLSTLKEFKKPPRIRSFSEYGKYFIITLEILSSKNKWEKLMFLFRYDDLILTKNIGSKITNAILSKSAEYVILVYKANMAWEEFEYEGRIHKRLKNWTERFKVLDTSSQKVIYDGIKNDGLIKQYKKETIKTKGNKGVK